MLLGDREALLFRRCSGNKRRLGLLDSLDSGFGDSVQASLHSAATAVALSKAGSLQKV